ncbi:MAG TPA: hypothetical protein VFX35_12460 [Solirubrobacterales bacterium]|nr:hypothetical protein [Solirubrobacterales bacterium]
MAALGELKDGLDQAGIDYQELVTTSVPGDAATFITVHCVVSMVDGDDRFYFGERDLNLTSQFVFDAQGKLDVKRSAFNPGLVLDTAETRARAVTAVDVAIAAPTAVIPER